MGVTVIVFHEIIMVCSAVYYLLAGPAPPSLPLQPAAAVVQTVTSSRSYLPQQAGNMVANCLDFWFSAIMSATHNALLLEHDDMMKSFMGSIITCCHNNEYLK